MVKSQFACTLKQASLTFSLQPCWWLCNQAQGVHGLVEGLLFDSVTRRYWDATNNLLPLWTKDDRN